MRLWNGWGSDAIKMPLSPAAKAYLKNLLGPPKAGPSVSFEDAVQRVPQSKLPEHPMISKDPGLRLLHSRGQSLPDWIALRFGTIDSFPDGVAQPSSEEEVEKIIAFAKETGVRLIPYGGGTSVVGHINPPGAGCPVLTVDLGNLRLMSHFDETSRLATFGAGVSGPHLEAQLRARNFTLGHFPQSFEYSTLGGWIATRSTGQQSLYYGRIEDMFAGGRMITPVGTLDLPPFPASAAGPDIRQIVLGSEGRLGIITKAAVRVSLLPEQEKFHAVFFPDWSEGQVALREIVQSRVPLSMLRLSNDTETQLSLILAGRERLVQLLHRLLKARGLGEEKCMLIFGVTGNDSDVKKARRVALDITHSHGGVHVGRRMGNEWRKTRFRTPYLRNTLWQHGYAVDTLESAFTWDRVSRASNSILNELQEGLKYRGENVLAFAHISHVYATGASVYVTHLFRIAPSADETLEQWKKLKDKASRTIIAHGGTISHQHGVGLDHKPFLEAEKGKLGLEALSSLTEKFDPYGIMNPGKLVNSKANQ